MKRKIILACAIVLFSVTCYSQELANSSKFRDDFQDKQIDRNEQRINGIEKNMKVMEEKILKRIDLVQSEWISFLRDNYKDMVIAEQKKESNNIFTPERVDLIINAVLGILAALGIGYGVKKRRDSINGVDCEETKA